MILSVFLLFFSLLWYIVRERNEILQGDYYFPSFLSRVKFYGL